MKTYFTRLNEQLLHHTFFLGFDVFVLRDNRVVHEVDDKLCKKLALVVGEPFGRENGRACGFIKKKATARREFIFLQGVLTLLP